MRKKINIPLIFFIFFVNSLFSQEIWDINSCIKYAVENNIDIKNSELNVERSNISAKQSKLNYLPTVSGSGNYGLNSGRVLDPTTYTFINSTTANNINIGVNAGITVFGGLKKYNDLKSALTQLEASESELTQLKNNISLRVSLLYLQILLNKEILQSVEKQISSSNQNIERMKLLVEAGTSTKGDLLNLIAQRSDEELRLTESESTLRSSKIELCQLMNIDDYSTFDVETPIFDINLNYDILNVDSIYEVAMKLPEIKSKELQFKAYQFDVKSSKAAYYPQLRASYNYGTSYSDTRMKPIIDGEGNPVIENNNIQYTNYPFGEQLRDNQSHGFGVSLSVPIFSSLSARNNVKISKLNATQAEYDIRRAKIDLYKDINQAVSDVIGAKSKYYASLSKRDANSENLRYTEERFKNGLSTITDYVLAKNNILMAEATLTQAKYELIFKLKVIDYYLCKGIVF